MGEVRNGLLVPLQVTVVSSPIVVSSGILQGEGNGLVEKSVAPGIEGSGLGEVFSGLVVLPQGSVTKTPSIVSEGKSGIEGNGLGEVGDGVLIQV